MNSSSAKTFRRFTLPTNPDLLDIHAQAPERYPFLLESVAHTTAHGRYDILFGFPQSVVTARDGDFLSTFAAAWRREADNTNAPAQATQLPFHGGWFVYLGYELAHEIEPTLAQSPPMTPAAQASALPTAFAARIPAAIVRDHARGESHAICEERYAASVWDGLLADCARGAAVTDTTALSVRKVDEDPSDVYLTDVARIQDYIRAGDVFQVNLSRGWRIDLDARVDATAIYRRLRAANASPFAGLVRYGNTAIVSSSPERLASVRDGIVRARPIAGTYRRTDAREDARQSRALLMNPKERAEHVMLIDLERNDLGRICTVGSVEVSELMTVETHPFVHHIVSEVRGRLRAELKPTDVIRAVFPGGTITGCPKIRCMEIVAELERAPRGPYTGSMGYVNHDGSLDLNILIRTLVHTGARIEFRAGAGIVADSVATRELDETRAKAAGLLRALGRGR